MSETINNEANREEESGIKREKVRVVPLKYVDDFPNHPFRVKDDDEMQKLVESIREYGVLSPVIARRKPDERYELISGHRRKRACQILGIELIPIIVRDLTREEAIIVMVDSNLHREQILPSEKAFAYKMKLEAIKCQGKRNDLTSSPLGTKLRTSDLLADESGDSRNTIHRYIRLTELTPELLEKVDTGEIAFRPAVEISYLSEEEQRDLLETIESEEATPSLGQAIRMKQLSQESKLDMDKIFEVMTEEKANQKEKIKIPMERIDKYFSRGTPPKVIEDTIVKALDEYQKKQKIHVRDENDRDER